MNDLLQRILRVLPSRLLRWVKRLLKGQGHARRDTALPHGGTVDAPARVVAELPLAATVTVVIPALNEAKRIASVVAFALADPATAEVLVVDDSSIDDTAALARADGARVVTSTLLGEGASMHDGAMQARQELLVYLDGDLASLRPGIISNLARPLLADEADIVQHGLMVCVAVSPRRCRVSQVKNAELPPGRLRSSMSSPPRYGSLATASQASR
jgi:hypothetical protein